MKDKSECGYSLYWNQCYRGAYDLIAPDSMAHPAKMSVALCYRILQHLQELGLLKDGDKILDPMAGTGITNICAGALGYSSVSVELEDKFVGFQEQNKEYAERRLYKSIDWQMIKGDSRKLSELLKSDGHISLTSPPYETSISGGKSGIEWQEEWGKPSDKRQPSQDISYGETDGQIGNLKDMPLKSITSPPYEDSQGHPSLGSVNKDDWGKEGKDIVKRRGLSGEYGGSEGQVGNLKSITSPPYQDALPNGLDRKAAETMVKAMYDKHGRTYSREDFDYQVELILKRSNREYGEADGQIGKLKDAPLKSITSPPYGSDNANLQGRTDPSASSVLATTGMRGEVLSEDNIGNLKDTPLKAITSPPYTDAEKRDRSKEASNEKEKDYPRGDHNISAGYQSDSENIGVLPDKPLKSVMSPPYDGDPGHHGQDELGIRMEKGLRGDYGKTEGQIGDTHSESYLEAMLKVYEEIAKVSDVLTVVVKNPTRGGKLRRLDLDTIKILEMAKWKIHCQHRALLFEELEQADLFEGSKKKVKGRLSFFKRLSWQNGQPVASWEDVIVCVRRA